MHTQLHRISPNIIQRSLNLLLNKLRRNNMNITNSKRILRRQTRRSCESITLMNSEDSLISFESTDFFGLVSRFILPA